MLSDFIKFIAKNNLVGKNSPCLLAVSGGIDSVVMTDLFHRAGYKFDIAHVNFQLRGEESGRDEEFVRKLAGKYGVKVFVRQFETDHYSRKNKVSIQVAARQLRYEWFDELLLKHGHEKVAIAHHLDDQVETFLINLARGTGIAGLHGIFPLQGNIIRPMLFTGRKEIEAYAIAQHLEFVEDSSNKSVKYTRNRIRHKIIPELEKLNPSFRNALTGTILNIRDVEAVFRNSIHETRNSIIEVKGDAIFIPLEDFFNLKPLETWAYELLSPYGFNLSNIKDIIGLKEAVAGKEVVSPTYRLVRDRDNLIIVPIGKFSGKEYPLHVVDLLQGVKLPVKLTVEILDKPPDKFDDTGKSAYLDLEKIEFPLLIRKWKRGDSFFPLGMKQRKKLSDFFIDLKYSKIDKEDQWLLCSGDDIVWVIGKRIDDRYKIRSSTVKILKIIFKS
jgi:tRNA(Ile)-lysidine synthase